MIVVYNQKNIMEDLKPRIIENVDLTIVGQKGNEQNAGILSERVSIMLHLEDKIKNVATNALCQVIWVKDQENTYDIFAGYVVSKAEGLPQELTVYQAKSEKIAVFEHIGDTKSLTDFIMSIYDDWLPSSGYNLNNTDFNQIQYVSQIEETDNLLPSEKRVFNWEIWVPIKISKLKKTI